MADKPRAGSMSDDDRALIGRNRIRTPGMGVPVQTGDQGDRTPVTDLLAEIHDDGIRFVVRSLWEHIANVELRLCSRINDETELRNELAVVREGLLRLATDLTGADGKNGKVGNLRAGHDKLLARAWWFFTAAVGGIGFLIVKLVIVTHAFSAVEAQSANNAARVQLLEQVLFFRSRPAQAPEKATQ